MYTELKVIKVQDSEGFDIEQLRLDILTGKRSLRITTHAQVEAFEDGSLLSHLRYTLEKGEVIESYPEDNRGLLYADVPTIALPVHIVVESTPDEGVIITAYIPDKRMWALNKRRRIRKK